MNNIKNFSFWKPVTFDAAQNPGKTPFQNFAWKLGSLCDQYLYLGNESLHIWIDRKNFHQVDFKNGKTNKIHLIKRVLIAASYVLTCYALPALAGLALATLVLVIKCIFKKKLNSYAADPNVVLASKKIKNTKIVLLSGNLFKSDADFIVNAANLSLKAGGGVCGEVQRLAGDEPFQECAKILNLRKANSNLTFGVGDAVLTLPGNLGSKTLKGIIHTVGPNCGIKAENDQKETLLTNAYTNALKLAMDGAHDTNRTKFNTSKELVIRKIPSTKVAFPSVSTGIFGYPVALGAMVALAAVKAFIEANPKLSLKEIQFVFLPPPKGEAEDLTAAAFIKALSSL